MQTDDAVTVGILADDLTSAADGTAPFVASGLQAAIGRGRVPREQRAVTAVDGGMRSLTAVQAGFRASTLAAELASRAIFYKTIDSTLRGHVRVELEASFKASGRTRLVFAPAFPAAGRTTVGGVQLGRVCGQGGCPPLIARKAGGFGNQGTLRRAIGKLRRAASPSDQERA